MDFYGMTIKGNCEVGTDNSYRIGNVGTRLSNVYSVYFTGIATSAQYADLAEKYTCKEQFPIGTVISVSYDPEYDVDKCEMDCDPGYIGVVSEKPGYLMNSDIDGLVTGLIGKLPVMVKGKIRKSDFIVPTHDGCARAGLPGEEQFKIGVCLADKPVDEIALVMCIIK